MHDNTNKITYASSKGSDTHRLISICSVLNWFGFLYEDSEDPDQTGQMARLIMVFS